MRLGDLINTELIKGKCADLRPEHDSIVSLQQVTVVGPFIQTDHMDTLWSTWIQYRTATQEKLEGLLIRNSMIKKLIDKYKFKTFWTLLQTADNK